MKNNRITPEYNKNYNSAKKFIDSVIPNPDKMTLNQRDELADYYNITFKEVTEIIEWSMNKRFQFKH